MLQNATFFEDQAVAVQEAAEIDDRDQARKSGDCVQYLFRGMSLMNVIVKAKCGQFVQAECCTEAVTLRLYSDLLQYETDFSWFGECAFCCILLFFFSTWRDWGIAVFVSFAVLIILVLVPATP